MVPGTAVSTPDGSKQKRWLGFTPAALILHATLGFFTAGLWLVVPLAMWWSRRGATRPGHADDESLLVEGPYCYRDSAGITHSPARTVSEDGIEFRCPRCERTPTEEDWADERARMLGV
jgi:hypothetical protein